MTKETLEKLTAECSENTSEIFTPNDFYGHAYLLKKYCGINQEISLPGIYPHAISFRDKAWTNELKHPIPFLLLKSKLQSVVYSKYCNKPSWIIGAPNYYAVRLIEDELKEIQSDAKGALILPAHSTHHLTNNYDFNEFVKYLRDLPEIFEPITICLGWRDIQLKMHERYLKQGFECTTAGHMYDKEFFFRLVRIIASHQFAITNHVGTSAFYAAAMDLPVILYRQKIETNPAKSDQSAYLLQEAKVRPYLPIVERFIETCINPDEQMIQHQKAIAQLILGYEDIKKPDELRDLFESLWQKNEMKQFIKKPNYIAEGSLGEIIETISKRVKSYPRKTPGKFKIDGMPFTFADLHSFYHQAIQIFGTDLYGFESETEEPVIVDCGAHIGLASLYFAKKFPKGTIYAFEADPAIAQMLKENVKTLGLKQVKIVAKAVWIHNEGVQFNITGDDSGFVCQNQNASFSRIPSIRLRDFLQNNEVDLLKIDIEGAEYDVIKDCDEYLAKAQHMIIEVHKFHQNGVLLGDILRILEKNGFNYSLGDLHVADWIKQSVKPPFANLKTDLFIITIFAWQQKAREEIQTAQINQLKLPPAIRMTDATPDDQCNQDSKRKNRSTPGPRILQVADHQMKGGAAIAGHQLFTGLKNNGVNVKLISFSASARNELACHDWVHLFKSMPDSFNQNSVNRPASPSQVWFEVVSSVLNNEQPEIINIHNIHEAIHYHGVPFDIFEVMAFKARLVFTLHDMWLLTGRCAYAGDCNRFAELSCDEKCPTVSEYPCLEPMQVSNAFNRKRELLLKHPETVIVAPSEWLAGEVRKSYLGNHRIEVIPYGIDLGIFSPDPSRTSFRNKCGIKRDEFVLLSAAADLSDKRKGMHLLWDALQMIKSEVVLMLVGNGKSIPALPDNVRVIHQGFVTDQSDMARLYSAADIFVCSTLADNLPCVLIESISCGTPCIGFKSGGVPDVVRPNITGWLADETSAKSLAKLINSIVLNPNHAAELRTSCRKIAESEYAINLQAERYEALFKELIENSDKKTYVEKLSDSPSNYAFIKNSPENHYKSIQPLIFSSRQKEAGSKLEKLLESYPDFALAHNDLGVLYYKQGNKEKAFSHYKKAAELQPENITFQKNLADFYYVEMGKVEEAMQIYVKVLNANSEDIETLLMLAHICVALEKFDDAKDFYNRMLKIDPGNKDAREFLEKLEKCQLSVAGGQTDQANNEADSNGYFVSAIVSTYNSERFMRGCLEDLENQTIADKIEIIVVDSGSEQDEESIVKEFQRKYSNIKYIKTENRENVYAAWNRAIKAATGKYITNANTDDRHRRDVFEVMVRALNENPEVGAVYADSTITTRENETFDNNSAKYYFRRPNYTLRQMLIFSLFGPHPMWRRSVHETLGYFDPSFEVAGDYNFFIQLAWRFGALHIREKLGLYTQRESSIENSKRQKCVKETIQILKHYRERIPLEEIYPELSSVSDAEAARAACLFDQGSCCLFGDVPDIENAIRYFHQAFDLGMDGPELTCNLALALYLGGQRSKGIELLRQQQQILPQAVLNLKILENREHNGPVDIRRFAVADIKHPVVAAARVGHGLKLESSRLVYTGSNDIFMSGQEMIHPISDGEKGGAKGKEHKPAVSVIVRTSNRRDFLIECLKSITNQTFRDLEVVLVNDGGLDVTQIIESYKDRLRIVYKRHLSNRGRTAALNTGLRSAAGQYVTYLDDDDIFYPEHIETLINEMEKGDYAVAYTDSLEAEQRQTENAFEIVQRRLVYSQDFDPDLLLKTNYIPILNVMHRRDCLDSVGIFDESLPVLEDWEFWIRLSRKYSFIHIPKVTAEYRVRDDSSNATTAEGHLFPRCRQRIWDRHRKQGPRNSQKVPVKMISLVILTCNQLAFTKKCIASIYKHTSEPFELIVVDNGSTDGTIPYLEALSKKRENKVAIKIIQNEKNLGFAAGNNQGIAASVGDYILLMNNDIVVTPGWLDRLIRCAEKDPSIGIVGPLSNYVSGLQIVNDVSYDT